MRPIATIVLSVMLTMSLAAQTSTTFTYQGRLDHQGQPYTGVADFRFTLFSAATGGTPIGEFALSNVQVAAGLFTAGIDFGGPSLGANRHLQVEVRTPAWDGQGTEPPFFTFPERHPITPAPYSLSTRGMAVGDDLRVAIGSSSGPSEDGNPRLEVFNGNILIGNDFGVFSRQLLATGTDAGFDTTIGGELRLFADGGERVRVKHIVSGIARMGIGIDTPLAGLHVNGGMLARGGPPVTGQPQTSGYAFSGANGDNDSGLFSLGNGQVSVFTDAVERIRFTSAGLRFADGTEQSTAAPGRIERGTVLANGARSAGTNFASVRTSLGRYTVTFSAPYSNPPTVVATGANTFGNTVVVAVLSVNNNSAFIETRNGAGNNVDSIFSFIAIAQP